MEDLGYAVDYNQAEPFTPPSTCTCNRRHLRQQELGNDNNAKQRGMQSDRAQSSDAKTKAIMYGKKQLALAKAEKAKSPPVEGAEFVADKYVSVIYADKGKVFAIGVDGTV